MVRRLLVVFAGVALVLSAGASSAAARPTKKVCGPPAAHAARCDAIVVTDAQGAPLATSTPVRGYVPADLQSAYRLAAAAASAGGSQTVAIVDAYDDPNAEADLATYRGNFGLSGCTTANGCFRKRDEHGGTNYPAGNSSWAKEISLDLDMVSAICPNCRILLVEGASSSLTDLGTAVNTAATLGATQISNSYSAGEFASESTYQTSYYTHPGIDVTVSSGDTGYGVDFPASSRYVTAVGGTSLTRAATARGWSETAWSGAGSGCSSYIIKPTWQKDTGCARRTVADVSAVADPNTGVAVYDSYGSGGTGWLVVGGTSVASPVVAAVDALAGGRGGTAGAPLWGSFSYNNLALFNDVTAGSNGSCGGTYLCTAKAGYDGPTGNGSPNGARATAPPPAPSTRSTPGLARFSGSAWTFYMYNYTSGQGVTDEYVTWPGTLSSDKPLVGDWTGSGRSTPGLARFSGGAWTFYMYNRTTGPAITDEYVTWPGTLASDVPLVGDWTGSGKSTPGLARFSGGVWTFYMYNYTSGTGVTDEYVKWTGTLAGDVPLVGDWTGSGKSTPGLARFGRSAWTFYMYNYTSGPGITDEYVTWSGTLGSDTPKVGDWTGSGKSTPGLARFGRSAWTFYMYNYTSGPGITDEYVTWPGTLGGDKPLVGNWIR